MMILMALVIAMFVIVGTFVGYHASQQVEEEKGEPHNINIDLKILEQDSGLVQILQNPELKKSLL